MFGVDRVCATHSPVIVRLDRTIQYSGTPAIERIGRGALDAPLRGYDSGGRGEICPPLSKTDH